MTDDRVMEPPKHKITTLSSEWPSGLKTADECARELGISFERLKGFADGGFAPHYRIDGGEPLFKLSELKRWAGINLVQRIEGRELPMPVRVIAPAPRVSEFMNVPESLREIVGLCDITGEILRTGIYFLCRDGALLYVGQSINAASRVAQHYRRYEFENAYFLPWPADDLDRIEAAFIRTLRPPLNGKSAAGSMRTHPAHKDSDDLLMNSLARIQTPEISAHHELLDGAKLDP